MDVIGEKVKDIKNLELEWKKAADYENMKIGESKMLLYFGESKYVAHKENDEIDIANVKSGVIVARNYTTPQFTLIAKANLINIHNNASASLKAVDFNILSPEAKAEVSRLYIGGGAEFQLAEGKLSAIDLKLAIGITTGFGIKDDSLHIELFGTGVFIGRKVGVSFLGSYLKIDLARLFWS